MTAPDSAAPEPAGPVVPLVAVVPCYPGFRGSCSQHGLLAIIWADSTIAACDALGHAAAHHGAVHAAHP
jgi:hypothetical protein